MDIAFVGLQNAGKTSLLRVLSVCFPQSHGKHACTDLFRAENSQLSMLKAIPDGPTTVLTAQGITNCRFQFEESNSWSCDIKMVSTFASYSRSNQLTSSASWDLGGQVRFRNMWERYCRGATAIVYTTFPTLS